MSRPWVVPTATAVQAAHDPRSVSPYQQQRHSSTTTRTGTSVRSTPPPPALYDTSVSSTTNDDSMTEAVVPPTPQRLLAALGRQRGSSGPASEPGTVDHDRFVAYVNRFANLDPRMDYRTHDETPSTTLTSSALQAAARTHQGRSSTSGHSEARLSQILRKHAGVAAASRRGRTSSSCGSESGAEQRSVQQRQIRQGLERYTTATEERPNMRQRPAISSPQQSLLRAVTDLRAGKQPTTRSRSTTTPRRQPTPPPRSSSRSHHFVSPPTSPDTSRSRSAPRTGRQPQPLREDTTPLRRRRPIRPTTPCSLGPELALPVVIQQVDDRAAIEIPSPTRVRDLRARLWNQNEQLRTTPSTKKQPIFPQRFVQAAERTTTTEAPPVVSPTTTNDAALSESDGDDDCDSTVSSITNPTYQDASTQAKQQVWQQHKQKLQVASPAPEPAARSFAEVRSELQHKNTAEIDSDSGILVQEESTTMEQNDDDDALLAADAHDSGILTQETAPLATVTPRAAPAEEEMSTGIITANSQRTTPQQPQQTVRQRRHPWQTDVAECTGPETNADGVETATTKKNQRIQREWASQPIVEEATTAEETQEARNSAAAAYEPFAAEEENDQNKEAIAFDEFSTPLEEVVAAATAEPLEEKERCPSARLDQATADALANEFDSAWVNVPASKYFGGGGSRRSTKNSKERQLQQQQQQQQRYKKKRNSARSSSRGSRSSSRTSRSSSRQRDSFRRAEEDNEKHMRMGYVPVDLEQDDERFGMGNPRQKETTKARDTAAHPSSSFEPYSNLRSHFDRQQRAQPSSTEDARSAGHRTHTSTGSRRFQEMRQKATQQRDGNRRLLVADHGSALRSRSVDRMRNPKTAKKYSRMLRVYNDDATSSSRRGQC